MHIAFVAMSGVRAWNPEITAAGLTMPGFLERSQTIASLPSLGLLTLAGMTPDEFSVSYHEVLDIHELGELPACDVAAISSFSAQIKEAYELADRYRAVGVKVVLGGLHVTAVPDEALAARGRRRRRRGRDRLARRARRTSVAADCAAPTRRTAGSSTWPTRRCLATTCSRSSATTG